MDTAQEDQAKMDTVRVDQVAIRLAILPVDPPVQAIRETIVAAAEADSEILTAVDIHRVDQVEASVVATEATHPARELVEITAVVLADRAMVMVAIPRVAHPAEVLKASEVEVVHQEMVSNKTNLQRFKYSILTTLEFHDTMTRK